jgi:hypothetical protein
LTGILPIEVMPPQPNPAPPRLFCARLRQDLLPGKAESAAEVKPHTKLYMRDESFSDEMRRDLLTFQTDV